ncbi:MAG: ribonucleotide reductase N-terminal alpha domain-containing protein, partial [Gammaproteobacteria bacterium]|nr:ribonucleotide reductase N-terminal alpha domain-containing protein [Gammaproteobacteria bacterium]
MTILSPHVTKSIPVEVGMQSASLDIWDRKYRLKDQVGKPVDESISGTLERVARALAEVEETAELRAYWFDQFCWALHNGAIPAGRILSNAGAREYKPATSTINCTVSGTIRDSMADILAKLHEGGMTLKSGSGIGYEF